MRLGFNCHVRYIQQNVKSSQHISDKNSERKIKLKWKVSQTSIVRSRFFTNFQFLSGLAYYLHKFDIILFITYPFTEKEASLLTTDRQQLWPTPIKIKRKKINKIYTLKFSYVLVSLVFVFFLHFFTHHTIYGFLIIFLILFK